MRIFGPIIFAIATIMTICGIIATASYVTTILHGGTLISQGSTENGAKEIVDTSANWMIDALYDTIIGAFLALPPIAALIAFLKKH